MASKLSASEPRRSLLSLMRNFASARSGNVAMISALMMVPMMGVAGIATDYAFAVKGQGKLNQVALIAATNAANTARNMLNVAGPGSNSLDREALAEGKAVAENFFSNQAATVSNASVASKSVTVTRTGNTITAKVTYSASVSTFIAPIFGVSSLGISGGGSMIVGLMDVVPTPSNQGLVIDEKWSMPAGTSPQISDSSLPVINDWYSGTPGSASPIVSSRPVTRSDGTTLAGPVLRVGNPTETIAPIISKKVYLEKGDYELRYWYKSTVIYPEYEPTFICGTVEKEVYWVQSIITKPETGVGFPSRDPRHKQSTRVGVYLDPILTNPQLATAPPTYDDFPSPARMENGVPETTRNRIDICVYSSRWIQRSIPIKVEAAGYFWLSFVSEPYNTFRPLATRNGFYLGSVQLCKGTEARVLSATACSGALNNNWPWTAGTIIYDDTFDEAPVVNTTPGSNNLDTARSPIAASSKYESLPPWLIDKYGVEGMATNDIFVYEATSGGSSSDWGRGNILRSTRLGISLYRRMLLMPGTYRFQFAASANERTSANPTHQWCKADESDPNSLYMLKPRLAGPTPGTFVNACTCPAGFITTLVNSDEGWNNDLSLNKNVRQTAPSSYRARGDQAFAMSDCHSGNSVSRTSGDVYCVLVPRTQYYGFEIRVEGPYLEPNQTTYPGQDVQLGTMGAYFDHLQVKVLSMGVTNNLTTDFPNFTQDCRTSLVDDSPVPTSKNVISSRIPMWPGFSTKSNGRVTVTAPKL